jgi:hypothetical protein
MASSLTLYNKFLQYIMDGTLDLNSNTIKLALVTSDYTPDPTHDVLADVLSSPSPEVEAIESPSNGYTAGGATVGNPAVTFTDSPIKGKFDADDAVWTGLTATFRYGILYASGTLNGVVNPLIGYILFDTTPADVVISGVDYTVQWNSSGIINLAPAA